MRPRIRVARKEARTVDGIVFDSMAEAGRYCELKILETHGEIEKLERQPRFLLQEAFRHPVHGLQRAIYYIADFAYTRKGARIVEDCKGMRTEIYRLKKKLLLAKYPEINFQEVKA